jgi:hypothetical protein
MTGSRWMGTNFLIKAIIFHSSVSQREQLGWPRKARGSADPVWLRSGDIWTDGFSPNLGISVRFSSESYSSNIAWSINTCRFHWWMDDTATSPTMPYLHLEMTTLRWGTIDLCFGTGWDTPAGEAQLSLLKFISQVFH